MLKKLISTIIFIIYLSVNSTGAWAHESDHSEVIYDFLASGDLANAYEHLDGHLSHADSTETKELLRMLMELDHIAGDTNMLLLHSLSFIEESINSHDSFNEMIGYYYLGKVYYQLYDDPKAIEYYERVLEIGKSNDFPLGIGLYNHSMGLIEYTYDNNDAAFDYFSNAQESFDRIPQQRDWIFQGYFDYNELMLDLTNALITLPGMEGIDAIEKIANSFDSSHWPLQLNALWEAAILLNSLDAHEKAVPLLEKAVKTLEKTDFGVLNSSLKSYLNYDLAYAYYYTGNYESAAKLALEDGYNYDTKVEVDRAEFLNTKLRDLETKSLREASLRQSKILATVSFLLVLLLIGVLIIIKEYYRIKNLTQEVYEKSIRDGLTGLYNRTAIIEKFESEATQSTFLGIIDIDDFKMINDFYGHSYGDLVIRKVADIVRHALADVGYAGRYGGEEFLFIIKDGSLKDPYDLSETIRKEIESISIDSMNIEITASIGLIQNTAHSFDDTFKLADQLLYHAKSDGKNKVRFFNSETIIHP